MRTRRVQSGEVELHVVEWGQAERGERGRPGILLVHGFPDDHEVFAPLATELARDFHVATFDMRGVGQSDPPRSPSGYRIEAVLPDLSAVIDAVFGTDVHLVAHDWGSVLGFSYLLDPAGARIRSFTSISGPHLGLMWSTGLGRIGSHTPRMLRASSYAFAFHAPGASRLLGSSLGVRILRRALSAGGVAPDDPYLQLDRRAARSRTRHAIELYRQNVFRPPPTPAKASLHTPLQLVIPERDPFVIPDANARVHEIATDLEVRRVDASHWYPRSHPRELAALVRDFVTRVEARSPEAA